MLNRRQAVLATAFAVPAAVFPDSSRALPEGLRVDPPYEFLPPNQLVLSLDEREQRIMAETGPDSPLLEEIALARRILEHAPEDTTPYAVAQYFHILRTGIFDDYLGEDAAFYAEEWPVRANPVIVGFFDATPHTAPVGDTTPWCAAFVNWCHYRATKTEATKSAASETFRRWGTPTATPKPGDIVVFSDKRNNSRGHVGYFVAEDAAGIFVLGGNQGSSGRQNNGEVNIRLFQRNGRTLDFHSFRSVD